MSDLVRVAVDAMGGDYAPVEPVKGAVEAVNADERVKVQLVGQVDVIEKELQKYTYPKERVEIVPATEIIETGEPPVNAIRHKKDSSIVVGMKKVRYGEADAFVSFRKHRSSPGRRTDDRRTHQGRRASAAGSADPDERRCIPSDRLRCEC